MRLFRFLFVQFLPEAALVQRSRQQLQRVVQNLVTNAVEALHATPRPRIEIRAWVNDSTFYLTVKDNGPGIPADARDKVFQLYFTTKVRGTGIGLAMTYRAVQLHNGTINFSTESGRGTAFQMTFPALVRYA